MSDSNDEGQGCRPSDGSLTRQGAVARHVVVTTQEAGQRVDNFLLRRAPGVPRSHVYRIIRRGEVRVDGGRVKPTRKLVDGETVRIPALRIDDSAPVRVPDAVCASLARAVVQEHADFLVLDKPAGIAVHGGSGLAYGAIDALRQARGEPALELVHRLDRGTSGALLVARDPARCRALQALFRERDIAKRYLALVDGAWPDALVTVTLPLLANREHAGERRVVVSDQGLPALSRFGVKTRFADRATELTISIETGRTHQIRVHAMASGHAVIGDDRYGDNRRNAGFKRLGLARLCLHAAELRFDWQGEPMHIRVAPGAPWQAMRDRLASAARA